MITKIVTHHITQGHIKPLLSGNKSKEILFKLNSRKQLFVCRRKAHG